MRALLLALPVALLVATPAAAQDSVKTAGAFLATCDARPGPDGVRPPENIPCLSYVAGLIDGYTAGAIAGGLEKPYCLPRPTTILELTDMIVAAIDGGLPPSLPTAAVVHIILRDQFGCEGTSPAPAAPDAAE